ncbi:uncharacterized protein UMAG_12323 [Mycosarcoma maydis]|uniref:Uncharacterized protein n=1 Tax=Mycosarcoma maydis TaxID=5270 RepID=A0A0D1DNM5_MYCMD|nr:uncharacterized protein UMAG_12323 [Ustilago maydis 521]KIS66024.1 hypothetical protein UMAG_12323 [Ustilago maydis 521]|eukprot:XP_011392524.1 hypothetical protein UMAG_12323 [Ustilago maydis 521]
MQTDELNNLNFTAMQRCSSLTASQDSLSPSRARSPSCATFFPSTSAADEAMRRKVPPPPTVLSSWSMLASLVLISWNASRPLMRWSFSMFPKIVASCFERLTAPNATMNVTFI